MPGEVKRETVSEIIWTSSTRHQLLVSLDQTSNRLSTFLKWKTKSLLITSVKKDMSRSLCLAFVG